MSRRKTLLAEARRAGALVGYPCRGEGLCGKCTVRIVEGSAALPAPNARERLLLDREGLPADQRIACLTPFPKGISVTFEVGGGRYALSPPGEGRQPSVSGYHRSKRGT